MSYEKVTQYKDHLIIGTKQTVKAMKHGEVKEIMIAEDIHPEIMNELLQLAESLSIPHTIVDSKDQLGKASGIDVGTATVAIKQ
ncbi:LSU ribosomal protein L7AE [Pelagirhabdus alkalitolerans]|uniref:LSU ribosomal protein L7AE n=1 Tax=Pelagirhabdus alkalitolerans TaxID=1612202 RepID=A0A1G6MBD0_9BACI|nr:ribosomal L7Ae/L30e/S12e/Gadd45 family protein [Pelagirhabdus alkalitolerans]SDC52245.1 LSU ribosomal protein L7AE [Pelagirhabdus alkalitolerans]